MSNNIYDILKKMQSLEAPKQNLTEGKKAKPDFADLDKDGDKKEPMKKAAKEKAKGGIAEAVARVEKNLAEKYMTYKKRLGEESDMKKTVIPVGVIDGPGGYEEAQKRIKDYEAGKISKDGKQLPPIEDRSKPADKPKTKAVDESGLQAYLGKKKYGEQGMKALQQAGRDGASKEKMANIRARHDKMDEGEADQYEQDPYGQERKKIKPGNTAGSKIAAGAKNMKRKAEKFVANTMGHNLERGPLDEQNYTEDMLSPGQKKIAKMSPPPGKIDANDLAALRAGKKKKAEGNAFSGAVAKAKATGQDEFNVGGKEYKVQEGWDDMMKAAKERSGPQPSGGSGIKAGKRYGGAAQKDEPETDNETGEVAKKGRGRPKKDKFAK
jgi:hypothetical protein